VLVEDDGGKGYAGAALDAQLLLALDQDLKEFKDEFAPVV
jgi:hypothetical protein